MGAKVLYIGMDACDAELMLRLAEEGRCPNLRALLAESAVVPTVAPYGTFVGSSWMTISTGLDVSRHGFWNWQDIDPHTYVLYGTTPRDAHGRPFWQELSQAGKRVAVLDVPHMALLEGFNGLLLKEWGCHDRHDGTESLPGWLLVELDNSIGRHPVGCRSHPGGHDAFAPCDYTQRDDTMRTVEEERALVDLIRRGIEAKRLASIDVMDREPWDLVATVFGEGHCAGHQFWHVHDEAHPRHDPVTRRLLGDPVEDVYCQLDAALGDLLARVGADAAVYVQMNHGMGPHFDGDHVLDELLARIDDSLQGHFQPGRLSRLSAEMMRHVPSVARGGLQKMAAAGVRWKSRLGEPVPSGPLDPRSDRRVYQVPGNTTVGAVRFNVVGREGRGRVRPGAEYEALRAAVAEALRDVIDIDTGQPLVRRCVRGEEVYDRRPDDRLPDLLVEWNRESLIERVWSPVTGTVISPYGNWRTGDHHDRGMLIARAPGVTPGRRQPMALVDSAPTIAAAVGVELPDVDGHVRWDVVAAPRPPHTARATPVSHQLAVASAVPPRRRHDGSDVAEVALAGTALDVASRAAARMDALSGDLQRAMHELHHRVVLLEREQLVRTTMSWLASEPVSDDVLVSVITPTYERPDRLADAIESVLAQRHERWEMVIVDDGSDSAERVAAKFDDARIRVITAAHGGPCAARNIGLEQVTGDVVTYLDDDNVLDPGWLHAVAWAFRTRPDTDVLYGARVVDDALRVRLEGSGGWPFMQFVAFDRDALLHHNFIDMGVIAHRRGLPARFDEAFVECGDWDFLLSLTEHAAPLELPAIAVYYRTGHDDRLTGRQVEGADLVRAKWARRRGGEI